jgi:hypothetical protein
MAGVIMAVFLVMGAFAFGSVLFVGLDWWLAERKWKREELLSLNREYSLLVDGNYKLPAQTDIVDR